MVTSFFLSSDTDDVAKYLVLIRSYHGGSRQQFLLVQRVLVGFSPDQMVSRVVSYSSLVSASTFIPLHKSPARAPPVVLSEKKTYLQYDLLCVTWDIKPFQCSLVGL